MKYFSTADLRASKICEFVDVLSYLENVLLLLYSIHLLKTLKILVLLQIFVSKYTFVKMQKLLRPQATNDFINHCCSFLNHFCIHSSLKKNRRFDLL